MEKTIHQIFKDNNIETHSHCSDLYVYVTPETEKIINGYKYKSNVTKFISNVDGKLMFDIPFANDDYRKLRELRK